jgi:hypothetical protein
VILRREMINGNCSCSMLTWAKLILCPLKVKRARVEVEAERKRNRAGAKTGRVTTAALPCAEAPTLPALE